MAPRTAESSPRLSGGGGTLRSAPELMNHVRHEPASGSSSAAPTLLARAVTGSSPTPRDAVPAAASFSRLRRSMCADMRATLLLMGYRTCAQWYTSDPKKWYIYRPTANRAAIIATMSNSQWPTMGASRLPPTSRKPPKRSPPMAITTSLPAMVAMSGTPS